MSHTLRRIPAALAFALSALALFAHAEAPAAPATPPSIDTAEHDSTADRRAADSTRQVAQSLNAQSLKTESAADSLGMDCEAPEFTFKRLTPRSFLLYAKSKKDGRFKISIYALVDDTSSRPRLLIGIPDTIRTAPEPGNPYDVFFRSLGPVFLKGGKVRVAYEAIGSKVCSDRMSGFQIVTVVPEHQLDIDAGWIYNLENDGHWDASGDFGLSALSHFNQHVSGLANFHFASLGRIDSARDSVDADSGIENPFLSRAGSLALNLSVEVSPEFQFWKRRNPVWFYPVSLVFGGGITTPPGQSISDFRPRFFTGLGLRVDDFNVNGSTLDMLNTTGCVRMLVAYDRLYQWQDSAGSSLATHEDFYRLVIEGELEIPGIGGKDLKPAVRGFIDMPLHRVPGLSHWDAIAPESTSGPGTSSPSRLSISLLIHVQMQVLEKLFAAR
ncbi:MAG TPA: hypothetical protein VJ385_19310 [Fibrobacteria bacterium]|nr:hypothetical protein [Fibrobacteria bacterium]